MSEVFINPIESASALACAFAVAITLLPYLFRILA